MKAVLSKTLLSSDNQQLILEVGLEKEFEVFKKETIPQILDPLQADGRILRPCLIHGNMYLGGQYWD